MSTLSARLKRLEKRFPSRRYDPDAHVIPCPVDEATIRDAIRGAIVNGLHPMLSDDEIEKLAQANRRQP